MLAPSVHRNATLTAAAVPLCQGPARLHWRADGGAEGEEAEGRAEERPPRDDRHHLVPRRPQPPRRRPRPQLAVL